MIEKKFGCLRAKIRELISGSGSVLDGRCFEDFEKKTQTHPVVIY
jgi:hypothetical protein